MEDVEEKYQRNTITGSRRRNEKGLRPVSVSKKELANKFTEQTMGIIRSKKPSNAD